MKILIAILSCLLLCSSARAVDKIVVVFDDSGSMDESLGNDVKIVAARRGVLQVLSSLPPNSLVGVVCINSDWRLKLSPLNKDALASAINPIQATGGTLLAPCMKKGADALLEARKKDPYGKCRLLIVTDGEAQDPNDVQAYTNDILSKGIILDVIGVKMESEHQLAKQARTYRNVTDPAALDKALSEAVAEVPPPTAQDNDFDLIAPIEGQLASDVLKAVANVSNDPIVNPGEMPRMPGGNLAPLPGGNSVGAATPNDGFPVWGIILIVIGGIIVVAMIVMGIAVFNENC